MSEIIADAKSAVQTSPQFFLKGFLVSFRKISYRFIKRFFDIIFGLIGCILILPLAVCIKIAFIITGDRHSIFFVQKRSGLHGRTFKMFKFRSMTVDNDIRDSSKEDSLTKAGQIIRKFSLDEVPQFFNVFKGDMSLVGPRPWVPAYYRKMNESQRHRYDVRPGITGLAQVNGRNSISIHKKISNDLLYIDEISLTMDIKIIIATIKKIFDKKGISAGKKGIHDELEELSNSNYQVKKTRKCPKESPLISIIIPVHDAEKYIRQAIQSVINQTYCKWELIIIDDKSTDSGPDIIKNIAKKDPRITFYRNNTNLGAAHTRNKGIELAKGEYIAFLDADDLWSSNKLEQQIDFMIEKNSAFSFTGYNFADDEGNLKKIVNIPKDLTYKQALKNTTISTITVMVNIKKIDKNLLKMPDVGSEDTATWWNILKNISKANGLNSNLSTYRRSKNTLSSDKLVSVKRTWNLYRTQEGFGIIRSLYYFSFYCFNAVKRRV